MRADGRALFKQDGALVVLQAEESVGHIKHQLRVERTEAEAILGMEALAQHLIFVVKIYVAAEIVERHAVQHAVRQIDLLVAFLADGHALDLGRQQAGRRVAADGAGLEIRPGALGSKGGLQRRIKGQDGLPEIAAV